MSGTRISSLLGKITVSIVICCCSLSAQGKYGGGKGEPNDPYLIYDANQMSAIGADSNDWDKHFKLMADIDLSSYTGTDFNTIGYYNTSIDNKPFTGVFDGNGRKISKFTYTATDGYYVGLFGYVSDPNAEIKNLGLIDPNVNAGTGWHFGSLVGYLEQGTVTGYSVDGGSISGKYDVGGLVGNNGGSITGCNSSVSVSGFNHIGGLVGVNNGIISHCHSNSAVLKGGPAGGIVGVNADGTITNCWSSGSVSGDQGVAGLAGGHHRGTITNCYSSASVSGIVVVGGLVGFNSSDINNCYAVGTTYGSGSVGGLVAHSFGGTIASSFWDVNTTGQTTSAGGTGKTTAEMQTQSTYTDAGWDFVHIWVICEGTNYPKLAWQIPFAGDFVCPDGVQMRDFAILGAQWLQPPAEPSADIAPNGGDNIVDRFDLAALVDNWLKGF